MRQRDGPISKVLRLCKETGAVTGAERV
jgi:hypothetical protein